jgi:hypothetical protein
LAGWTFEIEHPFRLLLFFSPGWVAYLLLIGAAAGKRFPGDPLTTWMPGIAVNSFWLLLFVADTNFEGKAFSYFYVRAYVVAAVVGGLVGFLIELKQELD